MEKFKIFYDVIEKTTSIVKEKLEIDSINSLCESCENLLTTEVDEVIYGDMAKVLKDEYKKLYDEEINKYDVRKAMQLLILKSFKEEDKGIEMTPDSISFLMGFLVEKFVGDEEINIFDPMCGTSSLITQIAVQLKNKSKLFGVDNDINMINVSDVLSNLLELDYTLYYQDVSNKVDNDVDVLIADLPNQLNELGDYMPIKALVSNVDKLKEDAPAITVIPNNFFDFVKKEEVMEHYNLEGLIKLPDDLFKKDKGKSILLLTKKGNIKRTEFLMLDLLSLTDKNTVLEAKDVINNFFERR